MARTLRCNLQPNRSTTNTHDTIKRSSQSFDNRLHATNATRRQLNPTPFKQRAYSVNSTLDLITLLAQPDYRIVGALIV